MSNKLLPYHTIPKLGGQGSGASLPSNSLLVACAGNVELDRYSQLMLLGEEVG